MQILLLECQATNIGMHTSAVQDCKQEILQQPVSGQRTAGQNLHQKPVQEWVALSATHSEVAAVYLAGMKVHQTQEEKPFLLQCVVSTLCGKGERSMSMGSSNAVQTGFRAKYHTVWASPVAQQYRIHRQCRSCRRCGFDPWVGKNPSRRAWQPTLIFLPGESLGQGSLAGYSPWGRTESDTTEVT